MVRVASGGSMERRQCRYCSGCVSSAIPAERPGPILLLYGAGISRADRITMRVLLMLLISNVCYCQSLVFGLAGGARLTNDTEAPAMGESKRYIVGPMIELGLPLGFAVEADALYSREGYYFAFNGALVQSTNSWAFPLLLKYRLPVPI